MLLKTINYVRGSVRISIEGACIERFLNICAANAIPFWGIKRMDIDRVEASVTIGGFFKLHGFARKCMCRIRVKGKSGAPFAVRRYRGRYALWGGAILCAGLMWVLAGFVWTIEISGCTTTTQREILQLLNEGGLKIGSYSAGVEEKDVKNYMLSKEARLSYVAVNIKGSHAQVSLREKEEQPVKLKSNIPCDMISDKTGVIEKLYVKSGVAMTEKGKTIRAGEPITTGTMTSQLGEKWLVHADAEVFVRTWRLGESVLSTDISASRPTGEEKTRTSFIVGNRRFKLYIIESPPFACYDMKIEKKQLTLPNGLVLPITVVVERFFETTSTPLQLSEKKVADILQEHLLGELKSEIGGGEIINTRFEYSLGKGKMVGKLYSECMEKCGVHVPIKTEEIDDGANN